MKKCNMASVNSIETFGLVDGPGIRTVVFFNNCFLRCKYCHNPEMWTQKELNYTVDNLFKEIIKNKAYFKNGGGVTFSGGEALLHSEFLLELIPKLKKEGIHMALDTSGVGRGSYSEILTLVDLVIFDVKHATRDGYKELTGKEIDESLTFIKELNKSKCEVWIRQVIIPNITDTIAYIKSLHEFIKPINNITKIEFLAYHKLGVDKYKKLNIPYILEDTPEMNKEKCDELFKYFSSL